MDRLLAWLGRALAKYLSTPLPQGAQVATSPPEKLAGTLEPGDVVLIEGNTRISVAIKYLTQSTWSHAALYVGDALGAPRDFDISPYFAIVKPTLAHGFDYRKLHWAEDAAGSGSN